MTERTYIGGLHVPFGMSPFFLTLVTTDLVKSDVGYVFAVYAGISAVVSFAAIFALRVRKSPSSTSCLPPTADVRTLTTDAFEYAPSDTGSNAGDIDDDDRAPIIQYCDVSCIISLGFLKPEVGFS